MKTKILFILLFLLAGICHTINAATNDTEPVLYKYNLVKASTYTADSGFDSSTPIENLWNGSTAEGVNDSKATGSVEAWIEFDFGQEEEIGDARLWQDNGGNRVTSWKVSYWTGDIWTDAFDYKTSDTSGWQSQTFDVKTSKVRFYARCSSNGYVSIHEIWLFTKPTTEKRRTIIGCVGDSNTAGTGGTGDKAYSWPIQLLKNLGEGYEVANLGVSGTTAQQGTPSKAWVTTSQYTTHKEMYSNISIIALGTNDSKAADWNATRYTNQYVDLIEEFRAYPTKPEVYILIPIKAFSKTSSIRNSVVDGEIRPILRQISKTYGVPVIDGYSTTDNTTDLMLEDEIHLNVKGQKTIADKVASILTEPKPVITIDGTPSPVTYDEYRWYKDGVLLAEASQSSCTATEPGIYKVAVKLNSTTDDVIISESFEVTEANVKLVVSDKQSTGIPAAIDNNTIRIQKMSGSLLVENAAGLNFLLFDITGKIVKTLPLTNSYENIHIADLSNGMYIYKVGNKTDKILK